MTTLERGRAARVNTPMDPLLSTLMVTTQERVRGVVDTVAIM